MFLRLPEYAKTGFVILGIGILALALNFDFSKTNIRKQFVLKILIGVVFMCIGSIIMTVMVAGIKIICI